MRSEHPVAALAALDDHRCVSVPPSEPAAPTAPPQLAPSPPSPASEGLGRYLVVRQLGRGAMGVVLAAYDPSLDRKVAIKVLVEPLHAGSEGVVRMQREAQAMARVSHPNVAQVYEVGEDQGRLYLVMEYIEGVTLREWLTERSRSISEVLRAFTEAGRGLAAAHAAGLIHRDFKPDNAMLGADGRVRVLDFGLSRSVLVSEAATARASSTITSRSGLTITADGTLIGTPAYMSPEQHMRRETDARSDQFSFCVALHEALHGARPFPGTDLYELGKQVVAGAIADPPPHSRVPAWLRQVVLRGLQPDPAARWPSMDALLLALGRDPRRTRRRWLAAGLAAIAIAGAGYGAAAYRVAQGELCSGAQAELRGVWDSTRREALAHVLETTGVTYAASVLAAVTQRLDAYAERWVATHTAACEAHRRGLGSDQLYDRRVACLRQRRTELAATVDVLMQTTADSVANLVEATVLPPLSSCEDDARLLADNPLPADPQLAAAIDHARARLARLQALERGGRHAEALTTVQQELATMQRLGDTALLAEGHLLAGKLRMHRMDGIAAHADFDRALELGIEARRDDLAAEALAVQIFQIGVVELRPHEALPLVPAAWAFLRRVGSPVHLAALLHNNIAAVHGQLGDLPRSIESYQRGLDLLGAGEDDPLRWVLVHNLAQSQLLLGAFDQARALGEPALVRLGQLYDRCHPVVTSLRAILGDIDTASARFDAAIANNEESVACFRNTSPANSVAKLGSLISIALVRGDDDAARHYLARADAIAATAPEARTYLATLTMFRAELELRAGHHDAARRLLLAEQARLTEQLGAVHPDLAAVHTGLAIVDHHTGADEAALAHLQRAAPLLPAYSLRERARWAFTHAQVLRALGREPAQVSAQVEQAIHDYRLAGIAFEPRITEIEAWAAAPSQRSPASVRGAPRTP